MTQNRSSQTLSIPELALAGFLSAVPSTLVTAPVERAKVLLQVRPIESTCDHRFLVCCRVRSKDKQELKPSIKVLLMYYSIYIGKEASKAFFVEPVQL